MRLVGAVHREDELLEVLDARRVRLEVGGGASDVPTVRPSPTNARRRVSAASTVSSATPNPSRASAVRSSVSPASSPSLPMVIDATLRCEPPASVSVPNQ